MEVVFAMGWAKVRFPIRNRPIELSAVAYQRAGHGDPLSKASFNSNVPAKTALRKITEKADLSLV